MEGIVFIVPLGLTTTIEEVEPSLLVINLVPTTGETRLTSLRSVHIASHWSLLLFLNWILGNHCQFSLEIFTFLDGLLGLSPRHESFLERSPAGLLIVLTVEQGLSRLLLRPNSWGRAQIGRLLGEGGLFLLGISGDRVLLFLLDLDLVNLLHDLDLMAELNIHLLKCIAVEFENGLEVIVTLLDQDRRVLLKSQWLEEVEYFWVLD